MANQMKSGRPVQKRNVKGKSKTKKKQKGWHWSMTFLLVAFLYGLFAMIYHAKVTTMISFGMILIMIVGFAVLSFAIQAPIFNKVRLKKGGEKYIIGRDLFIAYNLIGWGFLLTALTLQMNYQFRSDKADLVHAKILGQDKDYVAGSYSGIVYLLEGDQFHDDVDFRWFDLTTNTKREEFPVVRYYFYEGLFGFTTIGERFMVKSANSQEGIATPYL